ncbi:MAG: hypothetical protein LKE40_05875 [Spirochaetia bacterium]|jgi:hypothetical protein|nr:hypothetical protein [Spirochaetia bacterium]
MKKFIVFCLFIGIAMQLYASIGDIEIGSTAMYKEKLSGVDGDMSLLKHIGNYDFGASCDVRLLGLRLDTDVIYTCENSQASQEGALNVFVAAGLAFNINKLLVLSGGLGPQVDFAIADDGTVSDGDGSIDFCKDFSRAPFSYRFSAMLLLRQLRLEVWYRLPTEGFTIDDPQLDRLKPSNPAHGKVGISLKFSLL